MSEQYHHTLTPKQAANLIEVANRRPANWSFSYAPGFIRATDANKHVHLIVLKHKGVEWRDKSFSRYHVQVVYSLSPGAADDWLAYAASKGLIRPADVLLPPK